MIHEYIIKVDDDKRDIMGGMPLEEQPKELVRCKDCKNWIPGTITDHDDFIPPECGKYRQMVGHHSEDYCSLAESN